MSYRSSFIVRLARRIQNTPLWLFGFVEWPFVALFGKQYDFTQAIIVLALPRSGSTVTYQTLCHGLSVNYLSNLWNLFYQLPLVGGWLAARKARYHHSDFSSQHGFVPGLDGPAEGLRFWKWWLDCGLSDSDCHNLSEEKRHKRIVYLRRVLSVLIRRYQPFATAYLGHALVPDRVYNAFPNAVLIRLRREPVSNALSLLKSMRVKGWKGLASMNGWPRKYTGSTDDWIKRHVEKTCSSYIMSSCARIRHGSWNVFVSIA
jgi:hypothetical protein